MPPTHCRGYKAGSNEVETGKYSGFWLPRFAFANRILFPAFTPEIVTEIGSGKLYPVTAAQLLPNFTGIPHAAPQPQLTKN